MEAEVSAANRGIDELKIENEGLRRKAEGREARLNEKSTETENLKLELTAVTNEAEMSREIARVSQEAAERSLVATRDRAETAERVAWEAIKSLAAERSEHARLHAELRQEFRHTSDRQIALIEKVGLDLAQSAVMSRELENLLGSPRAVRESLS